MTKERRVRCSYGCVYTQCIGETNGICNISDKPCICPYDLLIRIGQDCVMYLRTYTMTIKQIQKLRKLIPLEKEVYIEPLIKNQGGNQK